MNLSLQNDREREGVLVADSIEEIHQAIDDAPLAAIDLAQTLRGMPALPPQLIETGYGGYNIVAYDGRAWGLPQAFGQMNIVLRSDREREGVLVADSVDALRAAIDAAASGKHQASLAEILWWTRVRGTIRRLWA